MVSDIPFTNNDPDDYRDQAGKRWTMISRSLLIIVCLVSAIIICGCVQQPEDSQVVKSTSEEEKIVFTDSQGNLIKLDHPVNRILPLSSQATELLITIGANDTIVGIPDSVMNRKDIMEKIPGVPSIGTGSSPDIEKIISLKPDVIVTYQSYKPTNFDKIIGSNVTVVILDCYKLENVSRDAAILGEISGKKEGAARYIRFNEKYATMVDSRLRNLSPAEIPRVYGEYSDYTAIVRASAGGQALAALHAENVFGDNSVPEWPIVSPEWILEMDPDIIIRSGEKSSSEVSLTETYSHLISRQGYENLKSVRHNRVYVYDKDLVSGPRTVIGLVYLAKAFYPDRFADIDPDSVRREYVQAFGFGDETQDWLYPPFSIQVSSLERRDAITNESATETVSGIP